MEGVCRAKVMGVVPVQLKFIRRLGFRSPSCDGRGTRRPRQQKGYVQSYKLTWHDGTRTESPVTWLAVYHQAAGVTTSMEKGDLSHGKLHKMANIVFKRGIDISPEEPLANPDTSDGLHSSLSAGKLTTALK